MKLGIALIIFGGMFLGLNVIGALMTGETVYIFTSLILPSIFLAWGIVRIYRKQRAGGIK